VDVVRAGAPVRTLGAGGYFGEIALLRDLPRTATCTARTDVTLYGVDRETFVAAVSGDLRAAAAAAETVAEHLAADRQTDAVVATS
jgi:CRP-like cAMP-binding protein